MAPPDQIPPSVTAGAHARYLELAAIAIDFPLTDDEAGELQGHLGACDSCGGATAAFAGDAAAIAALPRIDAPPRVRDAVLAGRSAGRLRSTRPLAAALLMLVLTVVPLSAAAVLNGVFLCCGGGGGSAPGAPAVTPGGVVATAAPTAAPAAPTAAPTAAPEPSITPTVPPPPSPSPDATAGTTVPSVVPGS